MHSEGGCIGFHALRRKFFKRYYALGASYYIRAYVNACPKCILKRVVTDNKKAVSAITSERKMQKIYIDFTDLNDSAFHLLDAIDHKTKFYWGCVYESETSENVIKFLKNIITSEGMRPEFIYSDRGSHFTSGEVQRFLEKNGIEFRPGKAYWPQVLNTILRVFFEPFSYFI